MKYKYFISYIYSTKTFVTGTGNGITIRKMPINDFTDIQEIENEIVNNDNLLNSVCLTNYQLLSTSIV